MEMKRCDKCGAKHIHEGRYCSGCATAPERLQFVAVARMSYPMEDHPDQTQPIYGVGERATDAVLDAASNSGDGSRPADFIAVEAHPSLIAAVCDRGGDLSWDLEGGRADGIAVLDR